MAVSTPEHFRGASPGCPACTRRLACRVLHERQGGLGAKKDARTPEEAEKKFAVTEGDLLEKLSVPEIEARERIVDPMGAVPDAPFGHLNVAWLKFKTAMEPHDSLSSFSARWSTNWGREETLAGYVIVRGDRIGAHFLTSRKILNDD